jgi:hypothetical protein
MERNQLNFWMTVCDLGCWVACFWWMNRISSRQNSLLDRLTEQTKRIERLSKAEHDLIKEVHPQVGQIKESMEVVIAAVKEGAEMPAARPGKG